MSSTAIELAKSLIRKGQQLGDLELIQMGHQILEEAYGSAPVETVATQSVAIEEPKRGRGRPKKVKVDASVPTARKTGKELVEQFTIAKPEDKIKSVPVNKLPRTNNWVDDGTEAKGDITPDYIPVRRERGKPAKVKKICGQTPEGKLRDDEGCGKAVMVDPSITHRELFICDECILKKVRK